MGYTGLRSGTTGICFITSIRTRGPGPDDSGLPWIPFPYLRDGFRSIPPASDGTVDTLVRELGVAFGSYLSSVPANCVGLATGTPCPDDRPDLVSAALASSIINCGYLPLASRTFGLPQQEATELPFFDVLVAPDLGLSWKDCLVLRVSTYDSAGLESPSGLSVADLTFHLGLRSRLRHRMESPSWPASQSRDSLALVNSHFSSALASAAAAFTDYANLKRRALNSLASTLFCINSLLPPPLVHEFPVRVGDYGFDYPHVAFDEGSLPLTAEAFLTHFKSTEVSASVPPEVRTYLDSIGAIRAELSMAVLAGQAHVQRLRDIMEGIVLFTEDCGMFDLPYSPLVTAFAMDIMPAPVAFYSLHKVMSSVERDLRVAVERRQLSFVRRYTPFETWWEDVLSLPVADRDPPLYADSMECFNSFFHEANRLVLSVWRALKLTSAGSVLRESA